MSKNKTNSGFGFWVSYLQVISLIFAGLGMFWAITGSFDPFGIYESLFARSFWNKEALPEDAGRTFHFLLGPFGATSAGYFVLQYYIARYAYARKELWGYKAIITAFLVWLITDTTMSLYHRAYFNIILANVPSAMAMLPVFFTLRYFRSNS